MDRPIAHKFSLLDVRVYARGRTALLRVHACTAMLPRMYTSGYERRWVATVAQAIERSEGKRSAKQARERTQSPTSLAW